MRDGVPEIEYLPSPSLGERLFYAHNVFILAGHKKAGKTWAMMLLAADQLRARRPVLYIDQENGIELFAERMLLLGVEPELVDQYLRYEPFPEQLPDLEALRREI